LGAKTVGLNTTFCGNHWPFCDIQVAAKHRQIWSPIPADREPPPNAEQRIRVIPPAYREVSLVSSVDLIISRSRKEDNRDLAKPSYLIATEASKGIVPPRSWAWPWSSKANPFGTHDVLS
jgi:hypothetical protein